MTIWDIERVRAAFPSLAIRDNGKKRIYLDAPAGSQVTGRVIERMREAMVESCANDGGVFRTSQASEKIMLDAHAAAAAFLGAASDEIVFGLNTTSLMFAYAQLLSRDWSAGDEIVLTRMDHDANVAPWLRAAEERGATVRWLEFDAQSFEYRYEMLDRLLCRRTRLVACNHASNIFGTINDVGRIVAAARTVGAVTVVDAVQSAPHIAIDVKAIGCDLLACSAYKFFGPHAAILYIDPALRDRVRPLKVRPSPDRMPWRFAPGTPSFEAQAGVLGAIEHFAALRGAPAGTPLRQRILAGIDASLAYEADLMRVFLDGAKDVAGLRLYGIGNPNRLAARVPTFSFRLGDRPPEAVARALAERNIFTWAGNFYAHEAAQALGIVEDGGVNRVGFTHYNARVEVDALLDALRQIAAA